MNYTAQQLAANWNLFAEYIDPNGTFTEAEFNAMSDDERINMINEVWRSTLLTR